MRERLLETTAAVAFAAVLFNTAPARADLPTIDVAAAAVTKAVGELLDSAVRGIGDQITEGVTRLETSVTTLLRDGFTQQANYTKASVSAQMQLADASNMVIARNRRDVRNAEIRDEHTANPQFCATLDNSQAPVAASIAAFNVIRAVQQVGDRRGEAVPGTPAFYGQAQAVQAINKLHLSRYCSATEEQAGLCAQTPLANADQHATSLFGPGTYADQDEINAANDFRTNLLQPVPPAAVRADQMTSLSGQDALPRRRAYNARMSLAGNVISYVMAVQTPSVPLTAQQRQQLQSEGLPPQTTGSWLQALGLEVNRRMSDPGWHASLQSMPPASVQREIATQLALSNYLAMQNYRAALFQASLSATRVGQAEEQAFREAVPMPTPNMVGN